MVDQFFLDSDIVNVDAATVGISSNRWVSIRASEASEEKARSIMAEHHFDVLPIESKKGTVSTYYTTDEWGEFSSVHRKTISYADTLPFRRSIRPVIKALADRDRKFFFLTQDQRVVGLLTVSNLNCRAVRVYLFGLITEMETGLGKLVESSLEQGSLSEQEITEAMKDHRREDYLEDTEEGIEESITEYLHLSTLVNIVAKHHLYEPLGYESRRQFEKGDHSFGSLVHFRNSVAHPVKSLKGTDGTPSSLWRNIETCERALFHLHNSSPA
ncbi:hypothetical protein GGP91_002946 [Salinibacter ruber]|uniref:hypothetical protein n=1 Tax=Salinibacter ruber TaxID=146919 RepID=UPI00216A5C68|nr:hypothetical protein [Salinibacter ruber]MCS3830852.1 hypothetical protein [Salinibacter ruber]